jgi:hypothetical protein
VESESWSRVGGNLGGVGVMESSRREFRWNRSHGVESEEIYVESESWSRVGGNLGGIGVMESSRREFRWSRSRSR